MQAKVRKENKAATTVQASMRGKQARGSFAEMRELIVIPESNLQVF